MLRSSLNGLGRFHAKKDLSILLDNDDDDITMRRPIQVNVGQGHDVDEENEDGHRKVAKENRRDGGW